MRDRLRTGLRLLRERDLHKGLWQLSIGFSMMGAVAGPSLEQALPSAIVGVQSIGLESVDQVGPMVFDAAKLNPS